MGALVSSPTRPRAKSAKGLSSKKFKLSRASGHSKRSSINRPVLQLQVEPATLERVCRRTASDDGTLMVTKNEFQSLAKESATYENIFPRPRYGSSGSSNHAHASRHHSTGSRGSQDSMVLLQIVENDGHLLISTNGDTDYDHLLPKGDYSHLCEVTYGHFHEHEGKMGAEDYGTRPRGDSHSDDHRASILYGRGRTGSILMTSGLSAEELKLRIHNHKLPEREGSFRRCQSVSTLATYQLAAQGSRESRLLQSADDNSDYWTLGESIIRTLSRRDMLSVDFENPQLKSDRTILEAWPKLKDKLKKNHRSHSALGVNGWV